MEDRLITPKIIEDDIEIDTSLRPKSLKEYIGQSVVKEKISIFIQAANKRKETLDHVLLYGPPGLGKTTLAKSSNEMGVSIRSLRACHREARGPGSNSYQS